MGHLLEKQGVQLAIKAMPRVLQRIPDAKLKIIGGGSYRPALEELVGQMGLGEHCIFLGPVEDIELLEREVAQSAVAIAPYVRALDTWTIYADPGKVKTYLACGVPVLLTDVPWNAGEIEVQGCGRTISENVEDIAEAIVGLMDKDTNQAMRERALAYAQGFDWQNIFKAVLQ
jgi:glycosyltransferase involved in cell wall biosynthesis